MRTLRIPGLLLIVGYVAVVAGAIGYGQTYPLSKQGWVEILYEPVGIGLVGFAAWKWMVASRTDPTTTKSIKVPTRIMAAASLAFGFGWAVMAHIADQEHSSFPGGLDLPHHYTTQMVSLISASVGFLLAAIGFWLASLPVRAPRTTTEIALPVA